MDRVGHTIIKRSDRAPTVPAEDLEQLPRIARGSEPLLRETRAIDPAELRGLREEAGSVDVDVHGEVETSASRKLRTEPRAPVIVDLPDARPTCAIDPDELRQLTRPPVLPIYHRRAPSWLPVACFGGLLAILVAGLLLR